MEPAQIADYDGRTQSVKAALRGLTVELSSDELFAATKKVADLMDHPGWVVLEQLMEARKARVLNHLVHGQTPEKHEFAALLSMISGIEQVLLAGPALKMLSDEKTAELESAQRAGEES